MAELYFGAFLSQAVDRNLARCGRFCDAFDLVPLSRTACEESASIRAELERKGARIGAYDVLIAGIALAEKRTLVTHNIREFARVPGLTIEDWSG